MAESLPEGFNTKVKRELNRIIKEVYNGNIKAGDIDIRLYKLIGQTLEKAVTNGFGKDFATVDFSTPDGEMLTRITRDVWQFSAAKNYQEMRDLTLALKDSQGNLRSFADFKTEAARIDEQYNSTWLRTEYSQAIAGSQMASKWSEFQQNADIMPMLQYDTIGDNNVRTEHQLLDGIIRHHEHDFWKKYYPPNGWGCRCSVIQLSGSTAQERGDVPKIKVPVMFKTNLAESGLVFPSGHAYYDGVPKAVLNDYAASLPDSVSYREIYRNDETGGTVKMHFMHGKYNDKEMFFNVSQAEYLADAGYQVKLLPDFGNAPDSVRKRFFKKKAFRAGKNPDAMINNRVFEFKHYEASQTSIDNNVRDANKQAENSVQWFTNSIPEDEIKRLVEKRIKNSDIKGDVWVFTSEHEWLKF